MKVKVKKPNPKVFEENPFYHGWTKETWDSVPDEPMAVENEQSHIMVCAPDGRTWYVRPEDVELGTESAPKLCNGSTLKQVIDLFEKPYEIRLYSYDMDEEILDDTIKDMIVNHADEVTVGSFEVCYLGTTARKTMIKVFIK